VSGGPPVARAVRAGYGPWVPLGSAVGLGKGKQRRPPLVEWIVSSTRIIVPVPRKAAQVLGVVGAGRGDHGSRWALTSAGNLE